MFGTRRLIRAVAVIGPTGGTGVGSGARVPATVRFGLRTVLGVVAFGCAAGDRPDHPSFIVTDSAGIEIVNSHAPAWPGGAAWDVSDTPSVRIGEVDGPVESTFGRIRAVGWLPDGRIFVGDEQAHTIRIFSPRGEFVASMGREGRGPGELVWFLTVARYGQDSLFVYDYAQRAVSIFGPDLGFARRFRNPTTEGNYWIVSALSDGRFVLFSPGSNRLAGGPGIVPDTSLILVSARDGSTVDTVGAFEVALRRVGPDGRTRPYYLGRYGTITTAGGRILWTDGRTFGYVEADPDGTVRRVVRKRHDPIPVTDAMVAEFRVRYLDRVSGEVPEPELQRARQSLEEGEYAPSLPATSANLEIDPQGHRWIGQYNLSGPFADRWEVFDSAGAWLGTVETPAGLEVHQIGAHDVIGVVTDDLGVQYVQVHRLRRSLSR